MPRTKGSKNKPRTAAIDYAAQLAMHRRKKSLRKPKLPKQKLPLLR